MKKIVKRGHEIAISSANIECHGEFWGLYERNEWEENTFNIFDKYLDKNCAYLDIGGWIGPTVLYAAHLSKEVHAFEPNNLAYKLLLDNVSVNEKLSEKISCHNFGVSSKTEKCKFFVGESTTSASSIFENKFNKEKSIEIQLCSFSDTIKKIELEFSTVGFIKVDIEGGEYDLIPELLLYLEAASHFPTLYISFHAPFVFPKKKQSVLTRFKNKYKSKSHNKAILNLLTRYYKTVLLSDGTPVTDSSQLRDNKRFMEVVVANPKGGK